MHTEQERPNWFILDSGLRVTVKYDYHPELGGAVTASFLAEREPTEADRKEADAFMLAVVANSPACAGVVYRSIRPAAGEGK